MAYVRRLSRSLSSATSAFASLQQATRLFFEEFDRSVTYGDMRAMLRWAEDEKPKPRKVNGDAGKQAKVLRLQQRFGDFEVATAV